MRVLRKGAVVGCAVVALSGLGLGAALADPPPGATPAGTDIVGVGAYTDGPLFDQLAKEIIGLVSWDAVGSSPITPKAGCPAIGRPNGSNPGITVLNENTKNGMGDYCIDFARSARGPRAIVGNGPDAFAVLASDAITWSSPAPKSGQTSPVPSTLTVADMTNIYDCTWTNWDQIPGNSSHNAPIVPVLPQGGSGERNDFLAALGHGVNNPLVPGPCVVNGQNSAGVIEENTGVITLSGFGNVAQFDPGGVPAVDDIFPYSVGDWIGQATVNEGTYNGEAIGGHVSAFFAHGDLKIHAVTSSTGVVLQPTVTDNTPPYSRATVINPNFSPQLQANLFDVVRNGGTATDPAFPTSPAYEANLKAIFGPAGFVCTNSAAKADIASYGFILRGQNCGALSAGS